MDLLITKERIYALPPAAPDGRLRCGLLIYTATAGTHGTLEVADRFAVVLHGALRRLEVCSSDQVPPTMVRWRTPMIGSRTVQPVTDAS